MQKQAVKKRPTQSDVARLAEVSQAMVSYVLNDNSSVTVPVETRQRIWDAVNKLGYVPDTVARSLRTRKTYTLACVLPDITNPFHTLFARGVQSVAEGHDYDLILYNTNQLAEKEHKTLRSLRQGRVDGVIMTPLHLKMDDLHLLLELNLPIVIQGRRPLPLQVNGYTLDSIYVNNLMAAHTAVSYLLDKGHKRIGIVAGQQDTIPSQDRMSGYRQALNERGIEVDPALIQAGEFKEEGGYRSMQELLSLDVRPTAIFAASDLMAVGALMAIKEAGLKVPTDIAVIGFDNIPIAKLVNPSLTTIDQFQEKVGQRAAQMLFDRMSETAPEIGRCEEMSYELVVRDSA
jgi:LacI family transcriptional regulator